MPVYCNNKLTIQGDSEEMNKLFQLIGPCIPDKFSMNNLYPVPPEYNDNVMSEDNKKAEQWKYNNWGCVIHERDVSVELYTDTTLVLKYLTLRTPNDVFIEHLSQKFPNFIIELSYYVPEYGDAGVNIYNKDKWGDSRIQGYDAFMFVKNEFDEKYIAKFFVSEEDQANANYSDIISVAFIGDEWEEAVAPYNLGPDNVSNWDEFMQIMDKTEKDLGRLSFKNRKKLFQDPYLGITEEPYTENLNNFTIYKAVNMWLKNRSLAVKKYGSISNWNTGEITVMPCLFLAAEFNDPIGNWDVSKVTDMHQMFEESSFDQDINNWDVSSVENFKKMFFVSIFNSPLDKWDVKSGINFENMFHHNHVFNQDIGGWNVRNAQNMNSMLVATHSFQQSLAGWDYINFENENFMIFGKKYDPECGLPF